MPSRVRWLRAALRDPLAQFLFAGALLVVAQRSIARPRASGDDGAHPRIVVDAAFVQSATGAFERSAGRPPTDTERGRLIEDAVDEEILFREAKVMRLDDGDAIVRRRLLQKAEFLIDDLRPIPEPTDAELTAYLGAHAAAYRSPLQLGFRHVFFSSDRRGAGAERDAQHALERLEHDGDANVEGDPFLAGETVTERSLRDVDGLLGSGVGDTLAAQAVGRWIGPIHSSYGFHVVRVESRREPTDPPLDQVRTRVRQALVDERRESNRRDARAALRARYVIERTDGATVSPADRATHAMNDGPR